MKRRVGICLVCSTVFLAFAAAAAEAQSQPRLTTFRQVLEAGGVTMKVIIALSILATFLVLFFLLTLRASVLCPKTFVQEAEDAAAAGDAEALQAVCESSGSPAARIVAAALEQYSGAGESDYLLMRQALEDEGARQAGMLWQRIQYLLDIAVVAPMVGLLGTVIGMLQSFSGLQLEVGAVKPVALAHGVSKALVTTAGGLIVGIAAMILYALFRGRVNQLIGILETTSGRILRLFISVRSGKGS